MAIMDRKSGDLGIAEGIILFDLLFLSSKVPQNRSVWQHERKSDI